MAQLNRHALHPLSALTGLKLMSLISLLPCSSISKLCPHFNSNSRILGPSSECACSRISPRNFFAPSYTLRHVLHTHFIHRLKDHRPSILTNCTNNQILGRKIATTDDGWGNETLQIPQMKSLVTHSRTHEDRRTHRYLHGRSNVLQYLRTIHSS